MKQNFSIYIFLCILFLGSAACQDDLFNKGGEIGEGESLVSATVNFKPLTPALNGHTRAAGDIIKSINSLCVLLYNEEGELLKTYPLEYAGDGVTTPGEGKYTLKDMDRSGDKKTESIGGENKDLSSAESETPHADFKLTIPYGRYYIYAVANMGDLSNNESYSDAIKNIEGLKSISLKWNANDIAANNQMFGYFTVTGSEQQDELAVINQSATKLHAWIRRAASKVTIAYDGSDLHENVYIYLKSVTIKDIPTECYLGQKSTINLDENPENRYGGLRDGESITYVEGTNYDEHYPARITKGKPFYYYTNKEKDLNGVSVWKSDYDDDKAKYAKLAHGEENEALFFYENMQGSGKDKQQDANGDGKLDAPGINKPGDKFYKDQKPYGTYIEVKAYYVSNVHGRVSNGDIIYRFMLGKNVTTDYNAERNHHYKLTLKFNKYANDVDWHIEYEEPDPGIEVPNPYYISYLYNHSMMLPLKIRTGGKKIQEIEARIVDNRWAPNNPNADFAYCKDMDDPYENQWNGFLSLRRTKDLNLANQPPITKVSNKPYYENNKRGERKYIDGIDLPQEGKSQSYGDDETGDGKYIIENEGDTVYHLQVPLYTRAKQLMKASGYTGNNPYVAYQRKAEIKIVVTFADDVKVSTDGTDFDGNEVANKDDKDLKNPVIYQVRRIVNPKGVWRKHDNSNKFHVQLKRLPRENATQFTSFASEGSWKAYVYCGTKNFVTLSNDNTTTPGEEVGGETGSMIDFDINFNGTCGESENRYAIIRVEYHNYTCYHLIFVRQGDAPDCLVEGGSEWLAYNMKTKNRTTDSPLEEGSLFKFGNWDYPIDAMCNKNPTTSDGYWINVKPTSFVNNSDNLLIATDNNLNKSKAKWSDITANYEQNTPFAEPNIENIKIASYADFEVLYRHEDIAEGYGVLYGNESNETLDDLKEVYEYDYEHTGRGMRGSFVYNKKSGKSLFFPVGASGYGQRKDTDRGSTENDKGSGILRYSSSRNQEFPNTQIGDGKVYPHGVEDAPLFYDIYMRPGAIYWLDKYADASSIEAETNAIGWDFNYFTFDFYPYGTWAAQNGKNAAFIRCVKK